VLKRDQHRPAALRWKKWIEAQDAWLITTELVLWEVLNGLAKPPLRAGAAAIYRSCHEGPNAEVVSFDVERMRAALDTYQEHKDKAWSLTDCYSFLVMQERGITHALTPDHHFEQAGFRALLLEDLPE